MSEVRVRPLEEADRPFVSRLLESRWGSVRVVSRGRLHRADALPGFVAERGGEAIGLATYHVEGDQCELVTLDSAVEGAGAGTALLDAVTEAARMSGCARLWLVTTNDNTHALRFYQKRGLTLAALHRNALAASRRLKPEIPTAGLDGIPLRDEIELERPL
jgi:ribosomal protein S18 acetylase RimI-like enzyme